MKDKIIFNLESINDWKLSLNFKDKLNDCKLISKIKIIKAFENVKIFWFEIFDLIDSNFCNLCVYYILHFNNFDLLSFYEIVNFENLIDKLLQNSKFQIFALL